MGIILSLRGFKIIIMSLLPETERLNYYCVASCKDQKKGIHKWRLKMIESNNIIEYFERYLHTETPVVISSFDGYKKVEIYTGDTLSDAWISARPDEKGKFEDEEFKTFVNEANGKWLEKRNQEEPYKIILSCASSLSIEEITKTYIHELVHILDYSRATKDVVFSRTKPGGLYFRRYSEYNAEKVATRYMAKNWISRYSNLHPFDCLAAVLGILSADAVHGAINSTTIEDVTYYIARYLGAQRAIRNLSMEIVPSPAFHLWTLTPSHLSETYGSIFYLANEWDDIQTCDLDCTSNRFKDLIDRVIASLQNGSENR